MHGGTALPDRSPARVIVCCTPFGEDWTWFVEELTAPDVRWMFFSDKARYQWQRWFQRPNLITPVGCLRAVLAVRRTRAAMLITVDPRLSFWCALWCRVLGVRVRHLVFSFNFPELPRGRKLPVFRYGFAQLDALRVHSTMEKKLYREHFGIPEERIAVALWAMNEPQIEPQEPLEAGDYVCALGGNARDYPTLLAAALALPDVPMVWVVRPENVAGLKLPERIKVVSDIAYPAAMNYLAHARFMVLPLAGAEVPCGHVTLVSAMYLGKAIVVTDSAGVSDYVIEGETGLLVPPGDPAAMQARIEELWADRALAERLGAAGREYARRMCSDETVAQEMTERFKALGLAKNVEATAS